VKSNRKVQREYDQEIYKERNKVERFFSRIKQFRRIATRYDNPARGNEKGRIENMVKYAERNFFVPVPLVESLDELNRQLKECCEFYLSHTQARQNNSVGERLSQEQSHLLPIPAHPPECCRIVSLKANQSALVQFETNRYSVPAEYAYSSVWLKAFVDRVEITTQEGVIATHGRLSGKYQESIRFEHYRKVLERKPGGLSHLRTKEKEPLPEKTPKPSTSRYPQVYVRPPDLTQYRQLLRNS